MSKDPRVYLAHIMECIEKIERFTRKSEERFFSGMNWFRMPC